MSEPLRRISSPHPRSATGCAAVASADRPIRLGARIRRARDRTGLLGAASDLRPECNPHLRPAGHYLRHALRLGTVTAGCCGGSIAFDFFFTEPYYSLTMTKPSEIWAAVLLFVIASIVTSVAAQSRRRAMEAREAAERAQALQALAHTVIEGRSQSQILQAAATALHRIFRAPAAILMQCENRFEAVATAGSAQITEASRRPRGGPSSHDTPEGIPIHTGGLFDSWPISTPAVNCVLGVDFVHVARARPHSPEQIIEVIAASVAAAFAPRSSRLG